VGPRECGHDARLGGQDLGEQPAELQHVGATVLGVVAQNDFSIRQAPAPSLAFPASLGGGRRAAIRTEGVTV
jgi:hypothetical protein